MRDLEALRLTAHAFLGSASFDLRMASARLAPTDVLAALHLAQLSARLNTIGSRGLLGLRAGPASPKQADAWLLAAARLHDAVSDAADAAIDLWQEAENWRSIVPLPEDATVQPNDSRLFGFLPSEEAYDGWTAPQDLFDLRSIALPIGQAAWLRRARIVEAANAWSMEHQYAIDAAGVVVVHECCFDLHGVLVAMREAVHDVRPATVAASRALARMAARSLVEMGDDARDLPKMAREYAEVLGPDDTSTLAWQAVEGLLVTAPAS